MDKPFAKLYPKAMTHLIASNMTPISCCSKGIAMGTALYIALEKNIPDVDTIIDGKMLSKAEKPLAKAAKRRGVRPLMDFFSTTSDEAAALLGEEVAGVDIPAAQWFSAEEGLRTFDGLLAEAEASPELRAAKDDLLGCQRVLREAQKHGVRWHLAIDF